MSYYETLRQQADKAAGAFHQTVTDLRKQITAVSKNLADERNMTQRLEARIERLKKEAAESLSQGKNTYEKYRVDYTKRCRDLETSKALVVALEQALSKKQGELTTASMNLRIALQAFVLKSRAVADVEINKLLVDCLNIRQDFLDTVSKIYTDFGLTFLLSDESYCPGPWRALEVRDLRIRLGMDATTAPEAVEPPATEVISAQNEQTAPDPAQIPSEAEFGLPGASAMPVVGVSGAETETPEPVEELAGFGSPEAPAASQRA
jgi:hypothetical protein